MKMTLLCSVGLLVVSVQYIDLLIIFEEMLLLCFTQVNSQLEI